MTMAKWMTGEETRLAEVDAQNARQAAAARSAAPRPSPAVPITLGKGTPVAVDFGSRMFEQEPGATSEYDGWGDSLTERVNAAIRSIKANAAHPDILRGLGRQDPEVDIARRHSSVAFPDPPQQYAIEGWASQWATLGSPAFDDDARFAPTDAEIVAAMEAQSRAERRPAANVVSVRGRYVPSDAARAAWSRELRRRVEESAAKRRLTVYGPIDDVDEV